jgi:hypothetical protein
MEFATEVPFMLPRGFQDADGTLHRDGRMRLATAADEILPLKDPRVKQNPAYLTVIVLSRVITRLGELTDVNTRVVEQLYASDVAYLQELYEGMNRTGDAAIRTVCPSCEHAFDVEMTSLGNA